MTAGGIWLFARPGTIPAFVLVVYQTLALVMNAAYVVDTELGSPVNQALVVHIFIRIIVIGSLFQGVGKISKNDSFNASYS
jgi:hypothetical protein